MDEQDIVLEIDFSALSEHDADAVREAIEEAEATLPEIVQSAEVRRGHRERKGALGLELLPILEIMVSAPAVLLLISEARKLLQAKLTGGSKITVKRKHADGTEETVTIETDKLDGAETIEALSIAKGGSAAGT